MLFIGIIGCEHANALNVIALFYILTNSRRDSYPPYGFYILHRVGMDDYIQRLYPEDSMQAHESYLMMRSYPKFTSRRLALANASLLPHKAEGPGSKFAPEFAITDPEKLLDGEKGLSQTVSLWCFATDARDPMQDVMIRSVHPNCARCFC
jgi:hypothetical protein